VVRTILVLLGKVTIGGKCDETGSDGDIGEFFTGFPVGTPSWLIAISTFCELCVGAGVTKA
jgi:hypothetical protein